MGRNLWLSCEEDQKPQVNRQGFVAQYQWEKHSNLAAPTFGSYRWAGLHRIMPFSQVSATSRMPTNRPPLPKLRGKFSHSLSPLAWQWRKMADKRRHPAAGTGARRLGGDLYGTTQSQPGLACDRVASWWRGFEAEGSNQKVHDVGMGFHQVTDMCRCDYERQKISAHKGHPSQLRRTKEISEDHSVLPGCPSRV